MPFKELCLLCKVFLSVPLQNVLKHNTCRVLEDDDILLMLLDLILMLSLDCVMATSLMWRLAVTLAPGGDVPLGTSCIDMDLVVLDEDEILLFKVLSPALTGRRLI